MRSITLTGVLLVTIFLLSPSLSLAEKPKRGVVITPQVPAGSVPITGDYWALIIGIDQYQHVPKLESAVKDAKGVRDVLVERYGFKKDRITELFNEQATGPRIQNALYQLGRQVGKDDSVFIYYAGHGQYDDEGRMGWWVPVEAQPKDPGTFIMDVSILNFVKGMRAKHVYLVADSCFSGTLFGTRALPPLNDQFYARLYAHPSRWGLTSGGTEPVADQGKNGHSIFAYHLINLLKENTDPYLVPSHIYDQLAPLVANNTDQTPRSEPLKGAGDEGGQFVFRLASASGGPLPPARPSAPTLSAPPPKDVDVSGYNDLEAVARLAEKREEAWGKVQAFAGKTGVAKEKRVAMLDKFLSDFADDNPHVGEGEALKQQIEAEIHVAKAPAYEVPRQTGREITGRDGAPMALVPEGEFLYGDDQQRKSLSAFYMDKYETSTRLYAAFLQATGREKPTHWNEVRLTSHGDRPVVGVTWYDADAYCRHYGKRLPTEQEWEKAARGTDGRKYPWGNDEPTSRHANFGKRGTDQYDLLVNVGTLEDGKSPYGIYDMAGNVWEWTSSDYDNGSKTNVIRGGSWTNPAFYLESTDRVRYTPSYRNHPFRVPMRPGRVLVSSTLYPFFLYSESCLRPAPRVIEGAGLDIGAPCNGISRRRGKYDAGIAWSASERGDEGV